VLTSVFAESAPNKPVGAPTIRGVDALAGPFAAAGALLALGGAFKVVRPLPTVGALRAVGAPASPMAVRALGLGEATVGVAAVLTGAPALAALVAAAYLAFAAFVMIAMRGGTLQSCGCFGEVETPPSAAHVLLNISLAGVSLAAAATGVPSLADTIADQPWSGVPFLLLVTVTVELCYLMLTTLPIALRATRL
jgi:uncharacterized membrane protein YphA (DoxX/SURF4 family)